MVSPDDSAGSPSSHVISVGGRQPSEALIAAVATLSGTEPTSLSPLYDVVDPEALDSLYEHVREHTGSTSSDHQITFPYEGYEVRVGFDGRIRLESESPSGQRNS